MSTIDTAAWRALKHLHHTIASRQADRITQGERIPCQAFLISQPAEHNGQMAMNMAEVAAEFIADLLGKEEGDRLLAKYLADALQAGSLIQQQIASEHGFEARYSLSVQESHLPQSDGQTLPVLMVLLHGQGFAMPIFHSISTDAQGRRHCTLRPFPEPQEIEAVQQLLQARMEQDNSGSPARHSLH